MFSIIITLIIYAARMLELKTARDTSPGEVRENMTLKLFIATGTFMLLGSIIENVIVHPQFNPMLTIVGVLFAVGSFGLRWEAIEALGKMWSLHVEIRDDHNFVTSGPFRYMRHPAYFSMIMELTAFGCLLQSAYTSLLTAIVFIPVLFVRIMIEEKALAEKLPGYDQYQRTVPMLFPYRGRVL